MAAVDTMTPARAAGMGALMAGINPKNLAFCVSAGVTIGAGGLATGRAVLELVVFVAVGSLSVGGPVLAYLVAQRRMQQPLDDLRSWLTAHNAAVMCVLLLVIGVSLLGKGLAAL